MKLMEGRSWAILVMLMLAMVGTRCGVKTASAALSAAQCKMERRVLINACKSVVYGKLPTPDCCKRMRVIHFRCMCPVITPKLAALIDLNRGIRLVEGCGRRVRRHFKCGSITTP